MPGISEFVREEGEAEIPRPLSWLRCPAPGCTFRCAPEGQAYRSFCGCHHTAPLEPVTAQTNQEHP